MIEESHVSKYKSLSLSVSLSLIWMCSLRIYAHWLKMKTCLLVTDAHHPWDLRNIRATWTWNKSHVWVSGCLGSRSFSYPGKISKDKWWNNIRTACFPVSGIEILPTECKSTTLKNLKNKSLHWIHRIFRRLQCSLERTVWVLRLEYVIWHLVATSECVV